MLVPSFVLASLASFGAAVATGPISQRSESLQFFKRDDPLTARDLELAEMHQVNLTQMYKHAVIRRGEEENDEDIHIWVDNSFTSSEEPETKPESEGLEKRQTQRVRIDSSTYNNGGSSSVCNSHRFTGQTSSSSPFTGGINAISRWGWNTAGQFYAQDDTWRDLLIGGSNSGANARFTARCGDPHGDFSWMGTDDIGWLSQEVVRRFRRTYSGRERAAGIGTSSCRATIFGEPIPGSARWDWQVYSTTKRP